MKYRKRGEKREEKNVYWRHPGCHNQNLVFKMKKRREETREIMTIGTRLTRVTFNDRA